VNAHLNSRRHFPLRKPFLAFGVRDGDADGRPSLGRLSLQT
jgi:hypothetical protein